MRFMKNKKKLGQRIRTFMAKRDMPVDVLAERTGLDVSFLTNVIEEDVCPSLGPLFKDRKGPGCPFGHFP